MRVIAVIPARMASSRFPGKPLKEIHGLPMVEHVRRRAALSGAFSEVLVATCDEEIASAVRRHGGRAVMTSPGHEAATDRVREAARSVDCTHVVNVQGDELLVLPEDLRKMVSEIRRRPEVPAWNAVGPIEDERTLADRSVVKCMVSATGRILFCTRDCSFFPRGDGGGFEPIRSLLGILGYRRDTLERYATLSRTPLEKAESIDQSRMLEHDELLQGMPFPRSYRGVNNPEELAEAQRILESDPLQREVLERVLGS